MHDNLLHKIDDGIAVYEELKKCKRLVKESYNLYMDKIHHELSLL